MTSTDLPPFASAFPADDEVEDARWLAGLIATIRSQAERQGHPEVAAALKDALLAAQAIVDRQTSH